MLRHAHAGARNHERRGSRNIERAGSIAAGSAGVHQRLVRKRMPGRKNRRSVAAHRAGEANQLVERFARGAQRAEQLGNLRVVRAAGENLFHHRVGFGARQALTSGYDFERVLDHREFAIAVSASLGI